MQTIIAGYNVGNRGSFSSAYTSTTTKTVFQTTDWKGTSYYFAGNPTDNWVRFGGFYWRIVRVNGDGSTRLIYQGTSPNLSGIETQIGTSVFNFDNYYSYYVGLMYSSNQYGVENKSTILSALDNWYSSSGLLNYSQYIDSNVGFCSDRNTSSMWLSIPNTTILFASRERISNSSPSLNCDNKNVLKLSIALITADEILFGGIPNWNANNTNNYLYIWKQFQYGQVICILI